MAKLSKAEYKLHLRACEIIDRGPSRQRFVDSVGNALNAARLSELRLNPKLDEPLNEIEFCFANWNPNANHIIGAVGAFFTPLKLAREINIFVPDKGKIVDICAGIGALSYAVLDWHYFSENIEITCVENNPEFVEIGKKLVPQAKWICADAYDIETWQNLPKFDCAILNPPYGIKKKTSWIKDLYGYSGVSELEALLIAFGVAGNGVAIVPQSAAPYSQSGRKNGRLNEPNNFDSYHRFRKAVPQIDFSASSIDTSLCGDFINAKGLTVEIVTFEANSEYCLERKEAEQACLEFA